MQHVDRQCRVVRSSYASFAAQQAVRASAATHPSILRVLACWPTGLATVGRQRSLPSEPSDRAQINHAKRNHRFREPAVTCAGLDDDSVAFVVAHRPRLLPVADCPPAPRLRLLERKTRSETLTPAEPHGK